MDQIEKIISQIKSETDFFNKARFLDFLRRKKDVPLKTIAAKLNLKAPYICQIMRLIRIPDIIVDGYYSKSITISHLFIIARLKDKDQMLKLYEDILTNNLTTIQVENRVREQLYGIKTTNNRLSQEDKKTISDNIKKGHKEIAVNIIQTRIKSKIIIELKTDLEKASNLLKKLFLNL